ncbi:MAG: efflux RND transporter periplasmic adaptor subunit, partial [Gammaproteobacteria bacterium]
ILRISPVVDPETGTFKVTIAVPDDEMRLKPGMFGRFQIVYDSRENVLLIPRAAVVEEENSQTVFVVEDDKATSKRIRTGFTRGDLIEVSEGLDDSDSVIIMGQSGLKNGAAVKVVITDPAGSANAN